MAFIRWKKSPSGTWKAYVVHSYRDEQGRVRQKHLAYLGDPATLTPERIEALKARHSDQRIHWDKIVQPDEPRRMDVNSMSDEELIQNLRRIRREHGLSYSEMADQLVEAGAPLVRCGTEELGGIDYKWIEHAVEGVRGKTYQPVYKNLVVELAPAVRRAFRSA